MHQGKLVSAQPGEGVALAHAGHKSVSNGTQQIVSGFVPERVVDVLEVVQVKEYHAHKPFAAVRLNHCMAQSIVEQSPVQQTRQHVMVG